MIAIFSALELEVRQFKKGMKITKTSTFRDCRVYEGETAGTKVLLVLTGMGKDRAEIAAEWVLSNFPVSTLVSSGFGGSLNDKTRVGDIAVYLKLSCSESGLGSTGESLFSDVGLAETATKKVGGNGFHVLPVHGVTISNVCVTPESKAKLGQTLAADVVDMESYWIGQKAAARKLPFITVRAIFDSLQDDLSLLVLLTGKGKALPAMGYLIGHPGQWTKAASYAANSRKAGRNLAVFLRKLIDNI